MARKANIVMGLLVLLGSLAGSAAACTLTHPTTLPWLGSYEDTNLFYLRAQSGTSGPFLGVEAATSPTSYADPAYAATSGAPSLVGSVQAQRPAPIEFRLASPLARDHYLNLSKPIIGKLFFASTISSSQASNARGDGIIVRFEVFTGAKRVAGFDYQATAQTVRPPWAALNFCLRPESRTLDAGQPLTVKVSRLNGFADFMVGVGGAQQSYIEFHTFDSDPLTGALYIEGKRLIRSPGGDPPAAADQPVPLGPASLTPLIGLALIAMGPRRGRIGLLAACLFLGAALAGCVGDKAGGKQGADGSEAPQPSVSVTYEPVPTTTTGTTGGTGAPTQRGAVHGQVVNPLGLPVPGAFVAALATSLHAETNSEGRFRFDNITPGDYVFRVDKQGFVSFEGNVTVLPDVVTKPTFTLTYPAQKEAGDKPHVHDDWQGEKEKVIWDKTFIPEWKYSPPIELSATIAAMETPEAPSLEAGPDPYRQQNCPAYGRCEYTLELPDNAYVYPGTGLVELTLQWTKTGAGAPQELGLSFTTPINLSKANTLVPRGPGDTFRMAIFPTEADAGHQKFTDWSFVVRQIPTEHNHPFGPAAYAATSIRFTLKIHKAVVPYERAHADFWKGATELEVFKQAAITTRCACDYPDPAVVWFPAADKFVPPETAELRGTLKWAGTLPAAALNGEWTLAYRAANVPYRDTAFASYPRVTITKPGADSIEFKIVPKDGEADQYYQQAPKWRFLLDDGDKPAKGLNNGYGGTFTLTVTAYKAP